MIEQERRDWELALRLAQDPEALDAEAQQAFLFKQATIFNRHFHYRGANTELIKQDDKLVNGFQISKETVVLCWLESETKIWFLKQVDIEVELPQ